MTLPLIPWLQTSKSSWRDPDAHERFIFKEKINDVPKKDC
jgi:hypothetical protein